MDQNTTGTDQAAALVRSFRVGKHYTVTMTMPKPEPGAARYMTCEWAPTVPTNLTKKELRQYRAGRDATMAAALAIMGGGKGLIIET